jgi:hypothetical protein
LEEVHMTKLKGDRRDQEALETLRRAYGVTDNKQLIKHVLDLAVLAALAANDGELPPPPKKQ